MWILLAGCASLVGIEELPGIPEAFPIELEGEPGHVTKSAIGQVAVDMAHPDEETARQAWEAMISQAEDRGYVVADRGVRDKRDHVVLEGPKGKLELACCARRADRQRLVLVSWWVP